VSRSRAVRALGIAAFVLAVLAAIQIARVLPLGYDFAAYWSAARHLWEGAAIYPAPTDLLGQSGQFKYLPIVAVPFLLLASLPLEVASLVWLAFEIAVAIAVGVALVRELAPDARPWGAAAYALFLPLVLEVTLGNLDLVSVALVLVAWHLRSRPARAAIPLALGVGLKLLPAAMLLFYLAAGRWRAVAYALLAGVAALVVTLPWLGGPLVDYTALFPHLGDTSWVRVVVARDEPALLADVLWSTAFNRLLTLGTIAGVILLGHRSRGSPDETQLHHAALAIAPYIAPFAFVWTTFLVMSLPLLFSTLARVLALRGAARTVRLAALAACWLLMQLLQLHDLVPVVAHLVGVAGLVLVGLVSTLGRSRPASAAVSMASA
jgi:arabinofuranan 3-O-arabinosyltransferase